MVLLRDASQRLGGDTPGTAKAWHSHEVIGYETHSKGIGENSIAAHCGELQR